MNTLLISFMNDIFMDVSLIDIFKIQYVGIGLLFSVMIVLFAGTALLRYLCDLFMANDGEAEPCPIGEEIVPNEIAYSDSFAESVSDELVAVISAAVFEALEGRPHRILKIKESKDINWVMRKRSFNHSSHKLG